MKSPRTKLLFRVLQLMLVLGMIAVGLKAAPVPIAWAATCNPTGDYEPNSSADTCDVTPGSGVSGQFVSANFQITAPFSFFPAFGFWVQDCHTPAVDEDYFTFALNQDFRFRATVTASGAIQSDTEANQDETIIEPLAGLNGYFGVRLYDPNNVQVFIDENAASAAKSLDVTATQTGVYKLYVYPLTATPEAHCINRFFRTGNLAFLNQWGGDNWVWPYSFTTIYDPPTSPVVNPDSYEPNDFAVAPADISLPFNSPTDPASSLTIHETSPGVPNDDFFRFFGVAGSYSIAASTSYGMDMEITLTTPSGGTIGPVNGANPTLNGTFTENGFYVLRVRRIGGAAKGLYTLNMTNTGPTVAADAFEQNDSTGTAAALTLPVTNTAATMFPAGDDDFYRFFANNGDTANVTLFSADPAVTYTLRLLRPDNTVAAGPTAASSTPSLTNIALNQTGNYLLHIDSSSGNVGNYNFNVNVSGAVLLTPDALEENDTAGAARLITTPFANPNLNIAPASDDDHFRFFAGAGTVNIQLFGVDPAMNFTLKLFNPDNTQVGGTQSGDNLSITNAAVTQTGYYRIEVEETVGGITGPYQLNVTYSPPAPGPIVEDSFEQNDNAGEAGDLGSGGSFPLTIFPANDDDFFHIFVETGGRLSVNVFSQVGGQTYTLEVFNPDGTLLNPTAVPGPNPSFAQNISQRGYYRIHVDEDSAVAYQLVVAVTPPAATSTPGPTPTTGPTSTPAPTPTLTPTPDLGGEPDIAEENNSFGMAFRLAPGNTVGLNFNSGFYGVDDIDYFVMNVKAGVTYTCQTSNLGLGTDTILAIYGPTPDSNNVIGIHDDIDAATGDVASQLTWDSAYSGQVYVVVDNVGSLTYPGSASYDLSCYTGDAVASAGGSTGGGGGGGGSTGSGTSGGTSAVNIQIIGAPERLTPPEPAPPGTLTVRVLIAYDANDNGLIDLSEGVLGMSVRAIDVNTNKQLAAGFTDAQGSLQLIITAEQGNQVLIVVPFLSIGKTFNVNDAGIENWQVLLPSSLLPGLIP